MMHLAREAQLLSLLQHRLTQGDLPGQEAQHTMAPPLRATPDEVPVTARHASVLALLYPIASYLHLLFIQRTSPARDRHAGQISFPGGAAEPTDSDAAATALREAREEVGIPIEEVHLLGGLTPLYIPVSNFMVTPFVGYLPQQPTLVVEEREVARTLELPLADFLAPEARQVGPRKLSGGVTLADTPYWSVRGEEIWGATSMITAELLALLRK